MALYNGITFFGNRLKSGRAGLAVDAPPTRPAPVRFSVGAGVPPTRLDARGVVGPVLRVIVPSSQKVFLFALSYLRRREEVVCL